MSVHGKTLEKDLLIKHHLGILYDQLLESNLLKIIQVRAGRSSISSLGVYRSCAINANIVRSVGRAAKPSETPSRRRVEVLLETKF